ncbi:IucA/IucC family protein [Flavivirga jejuensis]|uniref:IucA/IucC family siderophore biosynthesis protein n=1 Tax=Flavivirga jejuensis TaxID=870487 RepID=A0ABT8WLI3_9FLAO|nr:IucA/IucC family siderophore biosynthesis protein [Flavivirga jejuensis]MDO5974015.1 IucA/IucC family siderophore biosynthesis protein [Flavivirga jejuensis]
MTFISPSESIKHLDNKVWSKMNRLHLKKIISEFSHECLLKPKLLSTEDDWGLYQLTPNDISIAYHFRAKIMHLDHWFIDVDSIKKYDKEISKPLDSIKFIIEFKDILGFSDAVLPMYLEEISSTLYGSCYVYSLGEPSAKKLTEADYQTIEHAMIAGHPCFVANNGRVGFDADDYRRYAPESADPFSLIWLAGHKSNTEFTSVTGLNYKDMMLEELGDDLHASYTSILTSKKINPEEYIFFPVHPWQWYNKLAIIFASDIANDLLIYLGCSLDKYLPQQSIRTFFNISSSNKRYVKTSLSILNMGFTRGMSPYYMRTTPSINEWVEKIVIEDAYLQACNFIILKEEATVGYTNRYYQNATETDNDYKKMSCALWRESPMKKIKPNQKLMTMAALLHIDMYGESFLSELIKASKISVTDWVKKYIYSYLSPLLHCFYKYDMRFMPHGENIILVLEDHVPVNIILKDIGEEVAVNKKEGLPESVKRIGRQVSDELRILSIYTQIFDCFFRFLSPILVEHCDCKEDDFWHIAADCIHTYQQRFPEFKDKYDSCNLFAPEVIKTCLNRLQIRNNRKMINTSNSHKEQQLSGVLKNPLANFK